MRRLRFFLLERILLPVAIIPLKLLIATWRVSWPDVGIEAALMKEPRLIFVIWHGMLIQLMAYRRMAPRIGRRFVVLTSPSLDGRLLAATIRHFGADAIYLTRDEHGVDSAREFIAQVAAGSIGIIAADGPFGPCAIAKPAIVEMAAEAGARLALGVTSASRGITFGSWDRAHLPAPFARVSLLIRPLSARPGGDLDAAALQQAMLAGTREIGSPLAPAEALTPPSTPIAAPHAARRAG